MIETVSTVVSDYVRDLTNFLGQEWTHMSPEKYGILLLSIGLAGYLLMRSGGKV